MPRKPRCIEPDRIAHVTTRALDRRAIFGDDVERRRFLALLALVARRRGWSCLAWCLMTNHYHLVLRAPEPTLPAGMQVLNGEYARWFNRRHRRQGHLFERRYHDEPVRSDSHLLEVCRYVVLNPVRAGLCSSAGEWRWSSYRPTALLAPRRPSFLAGDDVLALFADDRDSGAIRYRAFVADGVVTRVAAAAA